MKRGCLICIVIIAILSGVPEALRQYRTVRESGATWLRGKMFEGILNSTNGKTRERHPGQCTPAGSVTRDESANSSGDHETPAIQLIGKINLGANLYVVE